MRNKQYPEIPIPGIAKMRFLPSVMLLAYLASLLPGTLSIKSRISGMNLEKYKFKRFFGSKSRFESSFVIIIRRVRTIKDYFISPICKSQPVFQNANWYLRWGRMSYVNKISGIDLRVAISQRCGKHI